MCSKYVFDTQIQIWKPRVCKYLIITVQIELFTVNERGAKDTRGTF